MKTSKKFDENRMLSEITIFSIFLMGFIDAYTFTEKGGVFTSAQTGNVIILFSRLIDGDWLNTALNISSFVGFIAGAFIGQAILDYFRQKDSPKYLVFLLYQILFLYIISFLQTIVNGNLLVFLLGVLGGYELTIFRKLGRTTVNNGIMTGNVKDLMNHFYKMVVYKNKKSIYEVKTIFISLLVFLCGIGLGILLITIESNYNLWTAAIVNTLFLLYLLFRVKRNNTINGKQHAF